MAARFAENPALRDPAQIKSIKSFQHAEQLTHCRVTRDGAHLLAVGYDGLVHRWTLADDARETFAGHHGWIMGMALDATGSRLYTGDSWGGLRAWEVAGGAIKLLWETADGHARWMRAMALSPDGQHLATCGNDRAVRVWSTADGRRVADLPAAHGTVVHSVAFHPDSKQFVSGDLKGIVHHWELDTAQPQGARQVRQLDASALYKRVRIYDMGGVRSMLFSPGGETLFCGGIDGDNANQATGAPRVLALDWSTGQVRVTMQPPDAYPGYVMDLAWHPDGYLIATGSSEQGGTLWFWKPEKPEPFFAYKHPTSFRGLEIFAGGDRLAGATFGDTGGQRGGNGRKLNADGQYLDFGGQITLFDLAAPAG